MSLRTMWCYVALSLLIISRKTFLKATSKIPPWISIRSLKIPHSSCEQMFLQHPFWQLLDTTENGARPAGPTWCMAASLAGGRSATCSRPLAPFCSLFKLHSASWVEAVFWMLSHFLNSSTNSTKIVEELSVHVLGNPGFTSTTWPSLLWWRCRGLCFSPVFKTALQGVLLHLMGSFKRLLF